jgi:hypothetical protein
MMKRSGAQKPPFAAGCRRAMTDTCSPGRSETPSTRHSMKGPRLLGAVGIDVVLAPGSERVLIARGPTLANRGRSGVTPVRAPSRQVDRLAARRRRRRSPGSPIAHGGGPLSGRSSGGQVRAFIRRRLPTWPKLVPNREPQRTCRHRIAFTFVVLGVGGRPFRPAKVRHLATGCEAMGPTASRVRTRRLGVRRR